MAHIFQTFKTRLDPATGKRVPVLDAKGRPVPHKRLRFEYVDWRGKRTTGTGYESRRETEALVVRLEREALEIRKGWREPPKSFRRHAARPVTEVMEEYIAWGNMQGGHGGRPWSADHARKRQACLTWWQGELGLQSMADLNGILPRVENGNRHAKGGQDQVGIGA